jgi:hypothetical protein
VWVNLVTAFFIPSQEPIKGLMDLYICKFFLFPNDNKFLVDLNTNHGVSLVYTYSSKLEEQKFASGTADYLWYVLVVGSVILVSEPPLFFFKTLLFLPQSFAFHKLLGSGDGGYQAVSIQPRFDTSWLGRNGSWVL